MKCQNYTLNDIVNIFKMEDDPDIFGLEIYLDKRIDHCIQHYYIIAYMLF